MSDSLRSPPAKSTAHRWATGSCSAWNHNSRWRNQSWPSRPRHLVRRSTPSIQTSQGTCRWRNLRLQRTCRRSCHQYTARPCPMRCCSVQTRIGRPQSSTAFRPYTSPLRRPDGCSIRTRTRRCSCNPESMRRWRRNLLHPWRRRMRQRQAVRPRIHRNPASACPRRRSKNTLQDPGRQVRSTRGARRPARDGENQDLSFRMPWLVRERALHQHGVRPIRAGPAARQNVVGARSVQFDAFDTKHFGAVHPIAASEIAKDSTVGQRMSRGRRDAPSIGKIETYQLVMFRCEDRADVLDHANHSATSVVEGPNLHARAQRAHLARAIWRCDLGAAR